LSKLADAIAATAATPNRAQCSIAKLLEGALTKANAQDLRDALANQDLPSAAISRGLDAVGHRVSALTVQRHRRGSCACPR
jgi:hypothetical protein